MGENEFIDLEHFLKYHSNSSISSFPLIVLVDSSASTLNSFIKDNDLSDNIFQTMCLILKKQYPNRNIRFIFWSSHDCNEYFKQGIWIFDHITPFNIINKVFITVLSQSQHFNSTMPDLAFSVLIEKRLDHWFNSSGITEIVYLTDGKYDSGRDRVLSKTITNLFSHRNNIRLCIHSVENISRNFNSSEEMNKSAGSDIAKLIFQNKLNNLISSFRTHNPACIEGFEHMSNAIVRKGYLPFGSYDYPITHSHIFMDLLITYVKDNNNIDSHMKVVQKLTQTIKKLSDDLTQTAAIELIDKFSSIFWFDDCKIDPTIANILLKQSVNGTSDVTYTDFRTKLDRLYKEVDTLLKSPDTKRILNIRKYGITYLIDDIIIKVDSALIDTSITINNNNYTSIAVKIYSSQSNQYYSFPVFTTETSSSLETISAQAIRQFTRIVICQIIKINGLNIDPKDDSIMYLVMAMTMRVVISKVPLDIKTSFCYLSKIMLGKKRLNRDITELERLLQGEFPLPNNGKIDDFYKNMKICLKYLNLSDDIDPLILWFAMCQSIDDKLAIAQKSHCSSKIINSYNEIPNNLAEKLLINQKIIKFHTLERPIEKICPVTMENISQVGGMMINSHNYGNSICDPKLVVKSTVFQSFMSNNPSCFYCYQRNITFTEIDHTSFIENDSIKIESTHPNPFDIYFNQTVSSQLIQVSQYETVITSNTRKLLLFGQGTVGCGKTTFWNEFSKSITLISGECYIEGTDKYFVRGISIENSVKFVKEALFNIVRSKSQSKLIVVVIDTCGERIGRGLEAFGVKFNGWERYEVMINLPDTSPQKIKQYLAFSLYNVLNRTAPDSLSTYNLNPETVDIKMCIDIHTKKAKSLLGNKFINVLSNTFNYDLNLLIKELKPLAEQYNTFLNSCYPLNKSINDFLLKIKLNIPILIQSERHEVNSDISLSTNTESQSSSNRGFNILSATLTTGATQITPNIFTINTLTDAEWEDIAKDHSIF